ncbi:MAG: Uma2 family endonuclease [Planctomycetaceae bacterium]|nr:Uma2 family endonuclease [Planctomycetaceae bacterium]
MPTWPIYRLTVEDYQLMMNSGALTEDDPVELLEGFLVPKMPKYPLHDSSIDYVHQLLLRILPLGWYVRIQNSLLTSDSVPEPDLVVLPGVPFDYREIHPTGRDVGLVIEVAESSVRHDRKKAAIYARAAVPEYWIVNLDDWQLERMTLPQEDGTYASTEILKADGEVPVILEGREVGRLALRELLTPPEAQG